MSCVLAAVPRECPLQTVPTAEQAQHTILDRNVDVKAAMPKSRGGSKDKGTKMFVGGVPV